MSGRLGKASRRLNSRDGESGMRWGRGRLEISAVEGRKARTQL